MIDKLWLAPILILAVIAVGGASDAQALLDNVRDRSVADKSTLRFLVNTDIVEGNPTYSLTGDVPDGATIDSATGQFRWIPEDQTGSHTFNITATDGSKTTTKSITVTVEGAYMRETDMQKVSNDKARFSFRTWDARLDVRMLNTNFRYAQDFTIEGEYDPNGDAHILVNPNSVRILQAKPTNDEWGTDRNMYLRLSHTPFDYVVVQNPSPVLMINPYEPVDEGTEIRIVARANDDDLPIDTLTFTDDGRPENSIFNIDGNYAELIWIPTEEQGPGTYKFNIAVSDSRQSDSQPITINVNEVNLDPVPTFGTDRRPVLLNQLHTFEATFDDPDLPVQRLEYELVGETFGATIGSSNGSFRWTPTTTSVGDITIRVNQYLGNRLVGVLDVPVSFVVHTEPPENEAPILATISNMTVDEGIPLTFTASATDDGLPFYSQISYWISDDAPSGASINGTTGLFSWTPTEAQGGESAYTFNVTASDGEKTDSQRISVLVRETNLDPNLLFDVDRDAILNVTHTFTASIDDADEPPQFLEYFILGESFGATIERTTGIFEWLPTQDHAGSRTITIRINQTTTDPDTDAKHVWSTDVPVNFNVINAPLTDIEDKSVQLYSTLRFVVEAPGGTATPTYGLIKPEVTTATIDPESGLFTWAPHDPEAGTHTFTATVSYDGTVSDMEIFVVTVTDPIARVNDFRSSRNTLFVLGDVSEDVAVRVTDLNGRQRGNYFLGDAGSFPAPIYYNLQNGAPYIIEVKPDRGPWGLDKNMYMSFTSGRGDDPVATPNPRSYLGENEAPAMTISRYLPVAENETISFTINADDDDGPNDVLTFTAPGRPAGSTLSATGNKSAEFSWTPTEEQGPGIYRFDVRVDDGLDSTSVQVLITVYETNRDSVPTFDTTERLAVANELHTFEATFDDPDVPAQRLGFAIIGDPLGATIDETTGMFNWTPTESHVGDRTITIRVSQYIRSVYIGDTDVPVTFDVQAAPPSNMAPVIDEIPVRTVDESVTLEFNVTATDDPLPFDSSISYSLSDEPAGATIDSATGLFRWTPTEEQAGRELGGTVYKFNVTASDGELSSSEEITIKAREVNQDPVPTFDTDREAIVGQEHSFVAVIEDSDIPVQYFEYSFEGESFGATIDQYTGAFSWTPAGGHAGDRTITVHIRQDGNYSYYLPLEFVVHAQPPVIPLVIENVRDINTRLYTTVRFQAGVSGADSNPRFGATGNTPPGYTLNTTTGVFEWLADTEGTYTFAITARTTATNTASKPITITVGEAYMREVQKVILNNNKARFSFQTWDARLDVQMLDTNFKYARDFTIEGRYDPNGDAHILVNPNSARILQAKPTSEAWWTDQNIYLRLNHTPLGFVPQLNPSPYVIESKPPILTIDPYPSVVEGDTITINARATDDDFVDDNMIFTAPGIPEGSTFDTGDDSATFVWTPTEEQGPGTYRFDITVSDGRLSDSQEISISVLEENRDPTPTFDTVRRITSTGVLHTFEATFDDPDVPAQRLEFELIGDSQGATIGNHTGIFEWIPTNSSLGDQTLTIRVHQYMGLAFLEHVDVPVNFEIIPPPPPNTAPTIDPVPEQRAREGIELTFTVTASDDGLPHGSSISYSLSDPPAGAAVDSSTGRVSWTPEEDHGGFTHTLNVTASDSDMDAWRLVSVSVTEENQDPVPTFDTDRVAIAGRENTFTASVHDPDIPEQTIGYETDNSLGATIDSTTGLFSWTPDGTHVGDHTIGITVLQNGTYRHTIPVNFNVPTATLNLDDKSLRADTTLRFIARTVGGGNNPTYGLVNAPAGATINATSGLFTWVPAGAETDNRAGSVGSQVGDHTFNITVTDHGMTDSKSFTVTVEDALVRNVGARIPDNNVDSQFSFSVDSDVDFRTLHGNFGILSGGFFGSEYGSGWKPGDFIHIDDVPNNGVRILQLKPAGTPWWTDQNSFLWLDDASLKYTAVPNPRDYVLVNNPPVLTLGPRSNVNEGQTLTVQLSATDDNEPDNMLTFTMTGPEGSTINQTDNNHAVVSWTPAEDQAPHRYAFRVTVSDGEFSDSEQFHIRTSEVNQDSIPTFDTNRGAVLIGETHEFNATFDDLDIPVQRLRFVINGDSLGATIDADTGLFSWTPTESHVGDRTITIRVRQQTFVTPPPISFNESWFTDVPVRFVVPPPPPDNDPPTLGPIPDQNVNEGTKLVYVPRADDDGRPFSTLRYSVSGVVPAGVAIDRNTGELTWTPDEEAGPSRQVFNITVSDGDQSASQEISIAVREVNEDPVFEDTETEYIAAVGVPFTLDVTATDVDLPAQTVSYEITSHNATGTPPTIGSDTGTISWTPNTTETVSITVRASDDQTPAGTADITVTVTVLSELPSNTQPTAGDFGFSVAQSETFTVNLTEAGHISDPEQTADTLTVSLDATPAATQGQPDIQGVIFTYTANDDATGTDTLSYTVTDSGGLSDSGAITVTITSNQDPVLAPIDDITVGEGDPVQIRPTATDADDDTLTYTLTRGTLPAAATFDTATGNLDWTTTESDGGASHNITITVSDGQGGSDSHDITITVTETNQDPELDDINNISVQAGTAATFTASATDDDIPAQALTYSVTGAPAGATINGQTGAFSWTPGTEIRGPHTFTVTVSDGQGGSDSQDITVTVSEQGVTTNNPPVLSPIGDRTVSEGQTLQIRPTTTDADDDTLTYTLTRGTLPAAATFDTTTGNLDWTTTESDGGTSYNITITVSDGRGGSDSEDITITVTETNQNPVFDSIVTEHSATVGVPFTLDVTATDADVPAQTITYEIASHNATGAEPAIDPATGIISWTPDTIQTVSITVRASDDQTPAGTADIDITVTAAAVVAMDDMATSNKVDTLHIHATANDVPADARIAELNLEPLVEDYPDRTVTVTINGTLTTITTFNIAHNGTHITYQPSLEDRFLPDGTMTFGYTLESPDGTMQDQATVTITLVSDDRIEAVDDFASTAQNTPVEIDVLANDIYDTDDPPEPTITRDPENGGTEVIGLGIYTYTPDDGYTGTDTFVYNITDAISATVTVEINTPPVAADDEATSNGIDTLRIHVTANDEPDAARIVELDLGSLYATSPDLGAITYNDTHVTYEPSAADALIPDGTQITFQYTLRVPGVTGQAEANVTITFESGTGPIEAVDDAVSTTRNMPVEIDVLANDTYDTEGPPVVPLITVHPEHGTVEFTVASSIFTYTPETDYAGADSFVYEISDIVGGQSDTATVTIEVSSVTPVVTATPRPYFDTGRGAYLVNIDVTSNIDGLLLHRLLRSDNSLFSTFTSRTVSAGDTWLARSFTSLDPNTTYFYEFAKHPDTGYSGDDVVRGSFTTGSVPLRAPDRTHTVDEDSTDNVFEPPISGAGAAITAITGPENGTAMHDTTTITYTPNPNLHGTDMINYTVTDSGGDTATGAITITITPVNDAPTLEPIADINANTGETVRIRPAATDIDDDTLTWGLGGDALPAAATFNTANGHLDWTTTEPDAGTYMITITVSDGQGGSDSEDITVTVSGSTTTNNPPVLTPIGDRTVSEGQTLQIRPTATDDEDDTLTYSLTRGTLPVAATFDTATGNLDWTTTESDGGTSHDITITVSDQGGSDSEDITITVTETNQDPELDDINDISVQAGTAATFTASATDDDTPEQTLTYGITSAPADATINDQTGAFSWTPDAADVGAHTFDVTVSDGQGGSDSQQVTITVTELPNLPPVAPDVPHTVQEDSGATTITPAISDSDGTVTITAITGPENGTATHNTTTITYTPNPDAHGTDMITYTVRDDDGAEQTGIITITITPVNDPPVLGPLNDRNTNVQTALGFTVTATDIDGDTLTFSLSGEPSGATINGQTGAFSWTPDAADIGSHTFTVTVSDGRGGSDSEDITVTVSGQGVTTNNPPALSPIGDRTVSEGQTLQIRPTATDIEDDTLTYALIRGTLPAAATFDTATGNLDWTPSESDGGTSHDITITVSDQGGSDSEDITITVRETNQNPVLGNINDINVQAGSTATFTATATDADIPGQTLTYGITGAPAGATINGQTGAFSWTPAAADAGPHTFTVTVSDGQGGSDSQQVTITVTELPNQSPTAESLSRTILEDSDPLTITPTISDPDGMANITAVAGATRGTATHNTTTITYTPNSNEHGSDRIIYTVTDDDDATATGMITITITPVNDAPVLQPIGNFNPDEGDTVTARPAVTDFDTGDTLTFGLERGTLPAEATFDPTSGTIVWTTTEQDGGTSHDITITVSDGNGGSDSDVFTITVRETNQNPVLGNINDISVQAGTAATFTATATDADIPGQTLTYSITGAPTGSTINGQTGAFSWTPGATDVGPHTFTVTVSDGNGGSDSETITVTVSEPGTTVNNPPALSPIGDRTVSEGQTLQIRPTATDVEDDTLTYTLTRGTLPAAATFDTATGNLDWTPSESDGGTSHDITITVSDQGGSDSEDITITVRETNQNPVLGSINNINVQAGTAATFTATATDADIPGQTLTYRITGAPADATINGQTGAFSWTPDAADAGPHTLMVTVSDGQGGSDSQQVTITVAAQPNQRPTAESLSRTILEDSGLLTITPTISDPDGTAVITAVAGANRGTVATTATTITYDPRLNENGRDTIIYTVTDDDGATATGTITITITPVNDSPVLGPLNDRNTNVQTRLGFTVTATDIDGDTLTFSLSGEPSGATINGQTGAFSWTPDAADIGPHTFTVTVSDGNGGSDSQDITVTVSEQGTTVNNPPALSPIGDRTVSEGQTLQIRPTATDVEDDTLTYTLTRGTLPAVATFDTATGNLDWTPSESDGGTSHDITITVSDQGGSDSEDITITVRETNQNPSLADVPQQTVTAGQRLDIPLTATDADVPQQTLTYSLAGDSLGATISGSTISWTPQASHVGDRSLTVTVQDSFVPPGSDQITIDIRVNAAGTQPPPTNTPPAATDFGVTVNAGQTASIDLTQNNRISDSQQAARTLTVEITSSGRGSVTVADTTVSYQAGASDSGTDTVTYRVTDNGGLTDTGTITVTIQPAAPGNIPPTAPDVTQSIDEDTSTTITPAISDPDGGTVTITGAGQASRGTTSATATTITYTPNADANGPDRFTYTVTDDEGQTATGTITINITPVNDPPVLGTLQPTTIREGQTLTYDIPASDIDDATSDLTFSLSGEPDGVSVSGSRITWTPAEDQDGTHTFTVTVRDPAGLTDSGSLAVTVTEVNESPMAPDITAGVINEDSGPIVITPPTTDPDGDPITIIGTTDGNLGVTTHDDSTITYTPNPDANGQDSFTYTVADGDGLRGTGMISITITPVNDPPVLGRLQPMNVAEGQTLTYDIPASDIDGDTLTFSAPGAPAGLSISGNRITWTPAEDQDGTHTFTITVRDPSGLTDSQDVTVTIFDVNDPPVLDSIPDMQAVVAQELAFNTNVTDGDIPEQTITYNVRPAHLGATIDGQGRFSWTPRADHVGDNSITITVSDGIEQDSQAVLITVSRIQEPIAYVTSITPGSVVIDYTVNTDEPVTIRVIDSDGVAVETPGTGSKGDNSYTAEQITSGQEYTYQIKMASDADYTKSNAVYGTFTAGKTYIAPTIEDIDVQNATVNVPVSLQINTTESGLHFSLVGAPTGASIDPQTGAFNWTPTALYPEDIVFIVTASDGTLADYAMLAISVSPGKSRSDDSSWRKTPTFGRSFDTNELLVSCGYSMDGVCRDVTDYHVDYQRQTIQTGSTHDFVLKAYGVQTISMFQIGYGMPGVGAPLNTAEALIEITVQPNYTAGSSGYDVIDIVYRNPNNVIDENAQITARDAACQPGFDLVCVQLDIKGVTFREQMYHEPFAIFVMDSDLRSSTFYMNDGLLIQGESLNPAPVATKSTKEANQAETIVLQLTRTDKLSDIWTDQLGNRWTQNEYGTWLLVYAVPKDIATACDDDSNRYCDAFRERLDEHNDILRDIRDEHFGDIYKIPAYDDLAEAITIIDMDGDSRTLFLEQNNMTWVR